MYFREQGSGPATVLFLHGNLSSSRWWEKVFALLPASWRLIAPDFRGFGSSEAPPEIYGLGQIVADVAALVEHLQLREFALVGHSLGGAVALQYALDRPGEARAVVFVDPVPANGLHFPDDVFDLLSGMRSSRDGMKEGLKAVAPAAPDDEFFDQLVQEALAATPRAFLEIPEAMARFDVTERLAEIACPALCILGEKDLLIPKEDVKRMSALIRNCGFVEMKRVGHCPPIEAPEEFAQLLVEFLSTACPWAVP